MAVLVDVEEPDAGVRQVVIHLAGVVTKHQRVAVGGEHHAVGVLADIGCIAIIMP